MSRAALIARALSPASSGGPRGSHREGFQEGATDSHPLLRHAAPRARETIPNAPAGAAHRSAATAWGARPVPFRTRKLSPIAPRVLRGQPVGGQGAADRWTARAVHRELGRGALRGPSFLRRGAVPFPGGPWAGVPPPAVPGFSRLARTRGGRGPPVFGLPRDWVVPDQRWRVVTASRQRSARELFRHLILRSYDQASWVLFHVRFPEHPF